MSGTTLTLTERFLKYFDIDLVASDVQRTLAARLRYQVYCQEFGFEPAADFPDCCERDPYDHYSVQCLVTHRRSQRTAGCARLICASEERPMAFEDHCRSTIYLNYLQKLGDERYRFCEASRLAVDSNFRKQSSDIRPRRGEVDHFGCCRVERQSFPLVSVATVLSVFSMASHARRNDVFAMMDSNLPRLLRRMGIWVEQAGDPMQYHGERALYYITTREAIDGMRDEMREFFNAIHSRLAPDFQAEIETCVA
ncbi:MAG: PEP-CTERM/exosortase system-associated acyltransferase [Gammaproteobacteria bacterium]|nr:PEP-CTERM/exosortase system-associated acyltransferase [Pseudomonadales bacterium]MCP5346849.1 PEP-CTERM/exosortase system-associated acyltransferase [Pseudomonadales bacterium]